MMAKKAAQQKTGKTLTIKLVKSTIGFNRTQFATVQGMGLRKLNSSVTLLDTPETRGMIHKVRHLVVVNDGVRNEGVQE